MSGTVTINFYRVFAILCVCSVIRAKNNTRKLIVVSLDAFKPEYLEQQITPNLKEFYTNGVRATHMNNTFPTKTFVNHFSIATGLYPQNHGVTGNNVYDHEKKRLLHYSYDLFHYNKNVTPIWTLNELQGHRSGAMMWAGSEYAYNHRLCTFTHPLDKGMSLEKRIKLLVSWLKYPTNPANLVMTYIEQPDECGHAFSPDSKEESNMVKKLDKFIVNLEQYLINAGIHNETDIIILSDHGMLTVTPKHFIDLYKFVSKTHCKMYGGSPVLQMVCSNDKTNESCRNLTNAANQLGTFKVYTDEQLFDRWHIRNKIRFGPCTIVAEPGYAFQDMNDLAIWFRDNFHVNITQNTPYGVHGYDNYDLDMKPIFMAKGPSFKTGVTIDDTFVNIDLYYLFCKLLHLNCNDIKIDGINRENIWKKMLKDNV